MSAPKSVSVTTAGVELVPVCAPSQRRNAVFLGRQDTDTRRVLLSFSGAQFNTADAAIWLNPGERITLTPDHGAYPLLVQQGCWAKIASGAAINVQVEF
jgi:hypothetical protein